MPEQSIRAATTATYAAFIGSGFAFASWASRIPQVRDQLGLDAAGLGLVLLAIAAGSLLALPLSGPVVTRIGSSRTVMSMAVLLGVGLTTAALGSHAGVPPVVIGLFLLGFANGAWDVAMNVQGTVVERRLGKSIMSRFHAGFSLGTVAGALAGAAMVAAHVSVAAHLIGVAVLVVAAVVWQARHFVADHDQAEPAAAGETPRVSALAAWKEPRTLLIGLFVLAFAFTEGVGNDWISVAAIDGHHVSPTLGTLAFAGFLTAMTVGRWFGPGLLDRYGRTPVVRVLALIGIAGVALFVFGPSPAYAYLGTLLWGLGASLGFPVGMSAGGDDPRMAAARVSVIASIGYCAFLGGPPTIGFLGDHVGVLRALIVVAALLTVAVLIATSVRPLPGSGVRQDDTVTKSDRVA
ncbi:putative MFS family arabinose efflux permease [Actinoplanes octamycinicus]|uniref:Putative MFS family arabinose efflux permease n=1 Tax=Actinoplanes octamycinicus TaxID=135948 RepID=A0A7W7M913_9ACTN|nr:MFS transporter [Actinoplanes octamycinicus]MBB4741543.1 putative MFS family arabinose efflux permease [Actinoplanes octamycinicus]GIE57094.1 MFS transporter [Actinoplanes octamycinicus]